MFTSGSPSFYSGPLPPNQWRQTPPPTASAVRTSKRKCTQWNQPLITQQSLIIVSDEERFDPYAPSTKRRAVSPSISSLRDVHGLVSPIVIPRSPILRPRGSFSQSQANSATSSPTVSQSSSIYNLNGFLLSNSLSNSLSQNTTNGGYTTQGHHRTGSMSCPSVTSSPTVRASMALASPVLRPVPRLAVGIKRGVLDAEGEREVEGAGEGVGNLTLG